MTVPRITGNTTVDIIAIVCSALLLVFFTWMVMSGVSSFVEWRLSLKSTRPIGEPAPATSEPAPVGQKRRRSPFAPKQREVAK